MTANKLSTGRDWFDEDDAPDLASPEYQRKLAAVPVKRGRPKLASPKMLVSMRLDPEIVASLRASGPGWQGRVNDILKQALESGRAARLGSVRVARKRTAAVAGNFPPRKPL